MSQPENINNRAITPLWLAEMATSVLGGIDLDPASSARANRVIKATVFITKRENGLGDWWTDRRFSDGEVLRIWLNPPVDVISGGFPCQDLSVAGKRKGLAGERSGLWFDLHSILRLFEPRWFVGENVPGLLSSNGGWDFAVLLGGLTRRIPAVPPDGWRNSGFVCGSWYSVAWRVLDARYFGLAQRRARVFIVASLGNGSCCQILFDRESVSGDSASSGEPGARIAATIRGRSASSGVNAPGRGGEDDLNIVAGCLQERDAKGSDSDVALIAFQPRYYTRDNKTGGAPDDIVGDSAPTIAFAAGQGEPNADSESGVAYCLDAGRGIQGVMRSGVRRLTPVECCRLQGFPDDWFDGTGLSDSAMYRTLGNAVAVPVVEWIGKRLVEVGRG